MLDSNGSGFGILGPVSTKWVNGLVSQGWFKPNVSRFVKVLGPRELFKAKRVKILVPQGSFNPNGSTFWDLKTCLS